MNHNTYLLLGLFILFSLFSCLSNDDLEEEIYCEPTNDYFSPEFKTFISPANGDFVYTLCDRIAPSEVDSFMNLSLEKVCELEQHLLKLNEIIPEWYCTVDLDEFNLANYHYQYLGYYKDGQEYIYINAFVYPDDDTAGIFENWKTQPVTECNGGISFWGATFDRTTSEIIDFQFSNFYNWVILPVDSSFTLRTCTRCFTYEIENYFTVSLQEVCQLHQNLDKLVSLKTTGCYYDDESIINHLNYGYQYVGVVVDNQRYIYINGFYDFDRNLDEWHPHWNREIYSVCDGGKYYWGVLFDLHTEEFSELEFSGYR